MTTKLNASIKLNPTRLQLPKFGNYIMLAMEYLAMVKTVTPSQIVDTGDHIELVLPYTKHSIKNIQKYINENS